jgi:hypothetical protein
MTLPLPRLLESEVPMSTTVTIKVEPREFDLIRKAVDAQVMWNEDITKDQSKPADERHKARGMANRYAELSARLNT